MPKYVYVFGTHDDHGIQSVLATLDRAKLPEILLELCKEVCGENYDVEFAALRKFLSHSDEELAKGRSGDNLSVGWGGIQFYVIELR